MQEEWACQCPMLAAITMLCATTRRALPPPPSRYVRELEVDYVPLMENSCDPGHVHFTHAGFIGSRDKAGPITVRMLEQASQLQAAAATAAASAAAAAAAAAAAPWFCAVACLAEAGADSSPDEGAQLVLGALTRPALLACAGTCTVLQDEVGVYRFVTEDPNKATFRNLVIKPPCMLW